MTKLRLIVLAFNISICALLLSCAENNSTKDQKRKGTSGKVSLDVQIQNPTDTIPEDSILVDLVDTSINLHFQRNFQLQQQVKVDVFIHSIRGYGASESFARTAADSLEEVLNSPDFRTAILREDFEMNRGMTSEEIYQIIMQAREKDGPGGRDGVVDLRMRTITEREDGRKWIRACTVYRRGKITVGKDGGGTGIMATCENWIQNRAQKGDHARLAAHIMHEYLHQLSFSHRGAKNIQQTVPYRVGSIVDGLLRNANAHQ